MERNTGSRKLHCGIVLLGLVAFLLGSLANHRLLPYLGAGWIVLALLPRFAFGAPRHKLLAVRISPQFALLMITLLLSALLCEAILQVYYSKDFPRIPHGLGFRYDRTLGWFPMPNDRRSAGVYTPIEVVNNSLGLRGAEYTVTSRPGIMFLGDSFVWGHDVQESERFTDKLQLKHPEWSIYNFGVTGYGTDQEFLLLQRHFARFNPRLVCLIFCVENDHEDNSLPIRNGAFKPYYTTNSAGLRLNGVPVPWSEQLFCSAHRSLSRSYLFRGIVRAARKLTIPPAVRHDDPTTAIIAEIQKYLNARNVPFIIGLTAPDPPLAHFLKESKIACLDLSAANRFPGDYHWSAQGHSFVSENLEQLLLTQKYFNSSHTPGQSSRSSQN